VKLSFSNWTVSVQMAASPNDLPFGLSFRRAVQQEEHYGYDSSWSNRDAVATVTCACTLPKSPKSQGTKS
jgi:hypothetical protein